MNTKGPFDPDFLASLAGLRPPAKPKNLFETLSSLPSSSSTTPGPFDPGVLAGLRLESPLRPRGLSDTLFPAPSSLVPSGSLPPALPPPPAKPEPVVWGAEYTRNFLKSLLRRRPLLAPGRVLPKLDDLAVMEGRQIEAAFVYTDLDAFSKMVATQPTKLSFVLLQAFVELITRITSHYGGAVVDCAGDRLLSVFHLPAKNYSDDPVHRAITSAFWIQTMLQSSSSVFAEQGISSPRVGIGIDYGSAVVGCLGFRNNKRLIFVGAAANSAARLQDLANAGETVLSYPVFLRKPKYMHDWTLSQESDEVYGIRVRVNAYFAQDKVPVKAL